MVIKHSKQMVLNGGSLACNQENRFKCYIAPVTCANYKMNPILSVHFRYVFNSNMFAMNVNLLQWKKLF